MATNGDWKDRITRDDNVLAGKPTIRGLRISVEHVLLALAGGVEIDELLQDYLDLEREDVQACLAFAAETVAADH